MDTETHLFCCRTKKEKQTKCFEVWIKVAFSLTVMPPWKQTTKLKAKQFLAEKEQNTVHIYSCHGVHTAKTLFLVISLFVMEFEIMLGIVRKIYGQFSHSSRDRNLLVQAAVGDNLPQDAVIGSLQSLCFSDFWNRQKQCMNSEGSTKEAKALTSSDRLWNLIGDCSLLPLLKRNSWNMY